MAENQTSPGTEPEKQRPKITKEGLKTVRSLLRYLWPYRRMYALGMVCLLISSSTSLAFPMLVGPLVNMANGGKSETFSSIGQAIFVLFIVLLLQGIFSFFRVFTFSQVTERAMADLRVALYKKLVTLPMAFYDRHRVGELMSRITADVQQFQTLLQTNLAELFRQIMVLVVGITYIIWLAPKLALFMLMIFPPVILLTMIFGRFIRKISKKTQDYLAAANIVVEESLQSISVVKAFTNENLELGRYRKSMNEVIRSALRSSTWRGAFITFLITALFGTIVLVIWRGLTMIQSHELQIGDLFSFVTLMVFIGGSVGGLGDQYSQFSSTLGATERVRDILEEDSELEPKEEITGTRPAGHIQYLGVHFRYPTRTDVDVLKGIHLDIPAGSKIALAGASGAGKSTMAQLLMRLYDLEEGAIQIDGKNIQEIPLTELRRHIGIVPQEVLLFGGTIRENISYGRPGASDEEIWEAARKANALHFIQGFPEGLDTLVGDRGVKLSGGQRQRIAIARAILKNPAILILDEATSSLDAESEHLVQEALDRLMEGRTTIIIAHRLATIRNVDCIYVLQSGQIVEHGRHEELAARDGFYSKLVKMQSLLQ